MARLLLANALLLDPERAAPLPGGLLLEDGHIAARLVANEPAPAAERLDLAGRGVAPGFVDLHYHGRFAFPGEAEHDAVHDALREAAGMVRHGVTAYLATTVAWPREPLRARVDALASALEESPVEGARAIGLHLEGPWINAAAAGAQPAQGIRDVQLDEVEALLEAGRGLVRVVTLAPEVPGVAGLLERLTRGGVCAALGHSLASLEQVDDAVRRGARHVTHLWNAMGPLHHRTPGLVGAALADARLSADLICDGAHVHPAVVRATARALGQRLVLITDRVDPPELAQGASLGSGVLRDDGVALRLPGGRLAGSRVTLDRALRNARAFADLPLLEAVAACTLRPARVLGVEAERGTLRPGARADLTLLDAEGRVLETWIGGRRVWAA